MAKASNHQVAYTLPEVAQILRISKTNVYALARSEGFPAVRITANRIIVPADALDRWLDEQTQKRS